LSEQGFAGFSLVIFNLPDNLTVTRDPSEQLCYGRRRQSHWSVGGNRADNSGARQSKHLLTGSTQTTHKHKRTSNSTISHHSIKHEP